jgi:putative transposase
MAKRHPPRLHASVYRGPAQYFLTICCYRRRKWFRKWFDDVRVRGLVESELRRTSEATRFAIIAYCLMPDHLHIVCEALSDESDLQAFVQLFKQRAAYAWKQQSGEPLWQPSYYDHVLREAESTRSVVRYTLENPVRARLVDEPGLYPHIGSFVYGRDEWIEWAFGWNRAD